jgi:hypothetical protein
MNFRFHKIRGISWLAEVLVTSQVGLYSVCLSIIGTSKDGVQTVPYSSEVLYSGRSLESAENLVRNFFFWKLDNYLYLSK